MSYFPGFFITQYHKSRSGYFINHDLLINGSFFTMQLHLKLAINLSSISQLNILLKNQPPEIIFNIYATGITCHNKKLKIWKLNHALDIRHLRRCFSTHSRSCTQKTQNYCNPRYRNMDCPCRIFRNYSQLYPLENSIRSHARNQPSHIKTCKNKIDLG